MISRRILLLLILAIAAQCQDAIISPKEPFNFGINESRPITEHYLIEVSA
jgi:hypothetical protein